VRWLADEPETLERERRERLAGGLKVDWAGFALIAIALGSLEVVLDRGQIEDWFKSDTIVIFTALAAVSFLLFLPWEINHEEPIVELRLLFRRQFGMAFLVTYTATLSGLAVMPGGLAMLVVIADCRPSHRAIPAEIFDDDWPNRDRAVDVVFDHAHAGRELRLFRLGARLSDGRFAILVHLDQYRRL
jgi:hypothetical protein